MKKAIPKQKQYTLDEDQTTALGQRIEALLEDTEDWQMSDEEFAEAIEFWLNLLTAIGETELEARWRGMYRHSL